MLTDEGFGDHGVPDAHLPFADGSSLSEDFGAAHLPENDFGSHPGDLDPGGSDEPPVGDGADPAEAATTPASPVEEPVHSAPPIVYTSADGTETPLGTPDQDLDGDGVAESVAVRTEDGDILMVSDTDGDGHPDQLIQVDPESGVATWALPDQHGGWEIVQTGHLLPDGSLVVDGAGDGIAEDHPHRVEVAVSGQSFDAGTATIDSDGDGVPDTVSVAGPSGSTLFYQDSNGDGTADRAWATDATGEVTSNYTIGAGGNWVSATVGGGD